eukprot:5921504-Prymnesium_polylepis.1
MITPLRSFVPLLPLDQLKQGKDHAPFVHGPSVHHCTPDEHGGHGRATSGRVTSARATGAAASAASA